MIKLNYPALRSTPIASAPYPHILLPGFVPHAELCAVNDDLPLLTKGGSFPIDGLRLGPKARALIQELEGPIFRGIVAERFELDLRDAPTMATLRRQSREKDGRIHTDSVAKRITVLLYLNQATNAWARQEGCLRLLTSPTNLDSYEVEVHPTDGTLLIFPNGPNTWHGHKQYVGPRSVIQLNYMTNDTAARSELRRHRWSAMVKGLVGA